MLTIFGSKQRFCDTSDRRSFLKIGALGMGGLTLPQILQSESQASIGKTGDPSSRKAVIQIFLAGGISHQDFVDMKPEAADNIRGEFRPIPTNVPGIEICEHMPRLAQMMDDFAIIRSIADSDGAHAATQCLSGYRRGDQQRLDQPCFGSFIAKALGSPDPAVPPFMGLSKTCGHKPWADIGFPGSLGRAYAPVRPDGDDIQAMQLKDISLEQLKNRQKLLTAFDGFKRDVDNATLQGTDAIYEQAFDVLTSSTLLNALDITQEDPKILKRYGIGNQSTGGSDKNVDDGPPIWNEQILLCRRLIEVGVRCVTLGYGRWDYHGGNFKQMRERLPILDYGVSALITDLKERDLIDDVTVLICSEFGRTPKINGKAGRDHWPKANCAMLAGGGMRTGQVIGSTTADAGYPDDRPVKFQEIHSTLYHNLGIDPKGFIRDSAERPLKLLSENLSPLHELV